MNLPPDQLELALADGVDIRTHKPRPNVDWDIIEQEHRLRKGQNYAKRK